MQTLVDYINAHWQKDENFPADFFEVLETAFESGFYDGESLTEKDKQEAIKALNKALTVQPLLPGELYVDEEETGNNSTKTYYSYSLKKDGKVKKTNDTIRENNKQQEAFIARVLANQKNMEHLASCLLHTPLSNLKENDYAGFVALRHRRVECVLVGNEPKQDKQKTNCVYVWSAADKLKYGIKIDGQWKTAVLEAPEELKTLNKQPDGLLYLLRGSVSYEYPLDTKKHAKIIDYIFNNIPELHHRRPFGDVLSRMVSKYDSLKQCANSIAHAVLKTHMSAMTSFGRTQAQMNATLIQRYTERYSQSDFTQAKTAFLQDLDKKLAALKGDKSSVAINKKVKLESLKSVIKEVEQVDDMKKKLDEWLGVKAEVASENDFQRKESTGSFSSVIMLEQSEINTNEKTVEKHRNTWCQNQDAITDSSAMLKGFENALEKLISANHNVSTCG